MTIATPPALGADFRSELRALVGRLQQQAPEARAAALVTALLFGVLFAKPFGLLVDAWWRDPNSGHGLLLAPLSLWFAWTSGREPGAAPQRLLGGGVLILAAVSRYAAELAAELFIMRGSMLLALAGLVIWYAGLRQLRRWWLPFTLVALSIPIPEVILNSVALPLQFMASRIGAALLAWREIPVRLTGNIIRIPGQDLFVAEACSGLRSLTALISLGVLMGALFLKHWSTRLLLLALTIPIAIVINGVRVFVTGFLVLFVSPELGQGFMHTSEGLLMFGGAFLVTAGVTWLLGVAEQLLSRPRILAEAT